MAQMVKNMPARQETQVLSPGREDPLEKGMVAHSRIIARRDPLTEKFMGSQTVRHEWATNTFGGGFPGGLDGKESAYSAGNLGSIPGSGRSPEEAITKS